MSKIISGNYTAPLMTADIVNYSEGIGVAYVTLSVDPTGLASYSLVTLPAHAIVLACEVKLSATVVATTAVKVGVGPSSDPDKYALTTALTANTYKGTVITVTPVLAGGGSTEVVLINATDVAGESAGTLNSGGTISVRLWYQITDAW